jgi:CheY-like chemotaxis protein
MEGHINVSSQVGQGAIFTVEIPIELAEASEIRPRRPIRRVIGLEPDQHAPDGGPYRILVVDDNPESRMLLRTLLEAVGFTVQEAANGQQAVELHESWQPHLIWMDLRMPVMDGYEATKRIREVESQKSKVESDDLEFQVSSFKFRTPIIAITSSTFEENRAVALTAGCDDFVRKPFHEVDIFAVMHKHLGVRYVYEESQKSKVPSTSLRTGFSRTSKVEEVLTPANLAALPSDLVVNLEQAIAQLDREMIRQVIEEIRPHDAPLADVLKALADNFQYDKILTFIQK